VFRFMSRIVLDTPLTEGSEDEEYDFNFISSRRMLVVLSYGPGAKGKTAKMS
jgi:hypothetical protein